MGINTIILLWKNTPAIMQAKNTYIFLSMTAFIAKTKKTDAIICLNDPEYQGKVLKRQNRERRLQFVIFATAKNIPMYINAVVINKK